MPKNPLAEVFGFPTNNLSQDAINHRRGRLCPFHNPSGISCTKSSATDPLGVCSIFDGNKLAITCPVRLRQDEIAIADAANFFFPDEHYIVLTEARLKDGNGKSAGNIDIVLAVLDRENRIVDFGAIEIQAVYISGNIRKVFSAYIKDPAVNYAMEWPRKNYPVPDYLSSSRKRLAPQLMFKGGILHQWKKKMAVVVHRGFFDQLPILQDVPEQEAEIVWLIYDFTFDEIDQLYKLRLWDKRFTKFENALETISTPIVGDANDFIGYLEGRIKKGRISGVPLASSLEPTIEPLTEHLEEDTTEIADEHVNEEE